MATKTAPLTAKEIAAQFETTPRTIRKFFRAEISEVGKGNRYQFTPAEVRSMRKKFDAWVASNTAAEKAADDE